MRRNLSLLVAVVSLAAASPAAARAAPDVRDSIAPSLVLSLASASGGEALNGSAVSFDYALIAEQANIVTAPAAISRVDVARGVASSSANRLPSIVELARPRPVTARAFRPPLHRQR